MHTHRVGKTGSTPSDVVIIYVKIDELMTEKKLKKNKNELMKDEMVRTYDWGNKRRKIDFDRSYFEMQKYYKMITKPKPFEFSFGYKWSDR